MTVAFGLAAALCWAIDNLISMRIARNIPAVPALVWSLLAGLLVGLPVWYAWHRLPAELPDLSIAGHGARLGAVLSGRQRVLPARAAPREPLDRRAARRPRGRDRSRDRHPRAGAGRRRADRDRPRPGRDRRIARRVRPRRTRRCRRGLGACERGRVRRDVRLLRRGDRHLTAGRRADESRRRARAARAVARRAPPAARARASQCAARRSRSAASTSSRSRCSPPPWRSVRSRSRRSPAHSSRRLRPRSASSSLAERLRLVQYVGVVLTLIAVIVLALG